MSELQAVLLCAGSGNRMPELTEHLSKSLLPVAGIPMFWFPLNSISKTGVRDVKLITCEEYRAEYEKLLEDPFYQWDHMQVEVLSLPRDHDDWGTGDAFRHFQPKFTHDVLVVSGDFISDMSLTPMIELFRCESATLCMLLSEHCITGNIPGPKVRRSKGRDLVAWCEQSKRIAFCSPEEDFEKSISGDSWINRLNELTLTAKLNDCHVYLLRNSAIELLATHKNFASLKADLVPFLLNKQFEPAASCESKSPPTCFVYVQPVQNGTIVAHANNLGSYFEISKTILKALPRISPRLTLGQEINFKATGTSCISSRVGDSSKISAGVVIKMSSIGEHVLIDEKARIQGSVVMDRVEIGKGAHISMSILCPGVKVMDGAEVVNCIISNDQVVHPNVKLQNELLEAESDGEDWRNEF
ncbi:unnamed protein product, partial [Mesorhabditis belari]|uniref:Translation initiation factor eIF2B subunit gamma n=1 Tax=Mesorhabditis belari TaxID=2138241 RepID=A0AAF3F0G0_9BILA